MKTLFDTTKPSFFIAGLFICVMLGISIRLALIIDSNWRIDYDEGMMGLLALHVMRGEFPAFIPAQPTLGTLEAYLLAPLFTIFGVSRVVFRVYSLFTAVAYIVTTALLARSAFNWRVGLITGLLCAVAPPYLLMTSLKTWGATIETIILGNLFLFFVSNALKADDRMRRNFGLVGFIAGLMFWNAWLGFYYFFVVGVVLIWQGRKILLMGGWVGLIGFLLGSLPFWIYNITHDFATFESFTHATRPPLKQLSDTLQHFINTLIPQLLTGDRHWGHYPQAFVVILMLIYGVGILSLWWNLRERVPPHQILLRWMLALLTIIIPVMYIFSSYSTNALNPWGIDATGRYIVMLYSVLPIGVGVLVSLIYGYLTNVTSIRIARGLSIGLVLFTVGINMFHVMRSDSQRLFDSPYYDRLPQDLTPLINFLDAREITRVWTDVGIGHVLMFETEEQILAADYYDTYIAGGLLRFPSALEAVANADRTVFIIPTLPEQGDMPIRRALNDANFSYDFIQITPTLVAIILDEVIDPALIAGGLGYQY